VSVFQIILLAAVLFLIYRIVRKYQLAKNVPHYNPEDAANQVKRGKAVFLDIRTKEERSHKKISNSFHIPLNELNGRLNELNRYKEKEIICYCRSGNRSLTAASMLQKQGFKGANLKGGMIRWDLRRKF
jgi:rhodanese-related sulfurtransferase